MHVARGAAVAAVLGAVLFTVLGPVACDRGEDSTAGDGKAEVPATKTGSSPAKAGACDPRRQAEIRRELEAQCKFESVHPGVVDAPWSGTPSQREDLERLVIGPDKLEVGGTQTSDAAFAKAFGQQMDRARQFSTAMGKSLPEAPWLLTIDAATPLPRVRTVLAAMHAEGFPKGKLVFATKPAGPVPQPRKPDVLARLHQKLDPMTPSSRATAIAKELEAVLPPCPDFAKVFGAVAGAAPDQKCRLLAAGIAEATVSCKCPPQEDDIVTVLYAVNVGLEVPTRLPTHVEITLDDEATPVDVGAAKTWAQLAPKLTRSGLQSFWLGD